MTVLARRGSRHALSFTGPCSIAGPITGAPTGAAVRVFLLSWPGLVVARSAVATNGAYAFDKVAVGEWVVLARDLSGTFNAVVRDRVATHL